jgi:hypothetical protein
MRTRTRCSRRDARLPSRAGPPRVRSVREAHCFAAEWVLAARRSLCSDHRSAHSASRGGPWRAGAPRSGGGAKALPRRSEPVSFGADVGPVNRERVFLVSQQRGAKARPVPDEGHSPTVSSWHERSSLPHPCPVGRRAWRVCPCGSFPRCWLPSTSRGMSLPQMVERPNSPLRSARQNLRLSSKARRARAPGSPSGSGVGRRVVRAQRSSGREHSLRCEAVCFPSGAHPRGTRARRQPRVSFRALRARSHFVVSALAATSDQARTRTGAGGVHTAVGAGGVL